MGFTIDVAKATSHPRAFAIAKAEVGDAEISSQVGFHNAHQAYAAERGGLGHCVEVDVFRADT